MAHFTITLPGDLQADVRTGKIRKVNLNILQLFKLKAFSKKVNTGYIVKVASKGETSEFHLMKSNEGKWLKTGEHYWLREDNTLVSLAIKQAIDLYEKQ